MCCCWSFINKRLKLDYQNTLFQRNRELGTWLSEAKFSTSRKYYTEDTEAARDNRRVLISLLSGIDSQYRNTVWLGTAIQIQRYRTISSLFSIPSRHRICIQQAGKRGGRGSSSFKLNLTDPCRILEWCWAGGLGQLFPYMRVYNAESLKQGSRRFNSIVKTKYIDDLGIVNLCLEVTSCSEDHTVQ